jgi:hypothetical protein
VIIVVVLDDNYNIVVLRRNNVTVSVRDFRTDAGYDVMYELLKMGYLIMGVRCPQRHIS